MPTITKRIRQATPGDVLLAVSYRKVLRSKCPEYEKASMRNKVIEKTLWVVALAAISVGAFMLPAQKQSSRIATASSQPCPNDDSGLTLPPGFCATVFA